MRSNIKHVLFVFPLAPHLSWADMILVSVLPSEISVIAQAGVHEYPIFGSMLFPLLWFVQLISHPPLSLNGIAPVIERLHLHFTNKLVHQTFSGSQFES